MVLLRCTDGRFANIQDWLYTEYHRAPYALGDRSCPYGPEAGVSLEKARHHRTAVFNCALTLSRIAGEAAAALDMILNAHRVTK